ncbi:MAG: hypothetical protein JXR11_09040 [Balneola sp.]
MKNLISGLFLLLIIVSLSCDRDDSGYLTEFEEGEFEGEFIRSSPWGFYAPSEVSLTLRDGKFEGTSSRAKFPAICRGSYEIDRNEIIFQNECPWTAEFDWSLILSGTFTYEIVEGELYLFKGDHDGILDNYQLSLSN